MYGAESCSGIVKNWIGPNNYKSGIKEIGEIIVDN